VSNNSKQVLYSLECDHAAPGPATLVSGALKCAWCQTPKVIVGVIIYEWAAVCHDCTFKRYSGLSKQNAMLMSQGHSRNNPTHIVGPQYIKNPTAEETGAKFRDWQVRKTA